MKVLASIDIRLAFWIDSLTFVFSAGCIYLMKTRVKMDVPDEKTSVGVVFANLKTGVRTIWDTPMLRSLPQEAQHSLGASVPFPKRLGEPREFAALVLHCIHNSYLNGEVIRLDGALRMPPKG